MNYKSDYIKKLYENLSNESDYIKKLYENLSNEKQEELSDTINDLIKEDLVELLEKKNFVGTDDSLNESLFEYGIVYREKDGLTIKYQGNMYNYFIINNDDLLEIINDMKEGFFKWLGCAKEDYIKWFNEENNKSMFICDISQYCDKLYEYFDLTNKENDITRVISLLTSEKE